MALKPGTKAYEDWRKKNFNLNIKVPQSAIDKLMAGKTPSNNIKKYAGTDNKVMREAMNRFYGKGWEKKAPGASKSPKSPNTPTTPPRNVPPVEGAPAKKSPVVPRGAMNPSMLEGAKKGTGASKVQTKKAAQKTLNKFMRSSAYRPTTSIGSFNPNAKVSKKDFNYNKLSPRQKEELNAALSLVLLPGVGGLAVKGAVAGTRAVRIANVGRLGNKGAKLLEGGKYEKGMKVIDKALKKGDKLAVKKIAKDPKFAKEWNKLKSDAMKGTKQYAPKAPKTAKTTKTAAKKTTSAPKKTAAKKTTAKKTAKKSK